MKVVQVPTDDGEEAFKREVEDVGRGLNVGSNSAVT